MAPAQPFTLPGVAGLIGETALTCLLWQQFFAGFLMRKLYVWAQAQPFWESITKRQGNLARNGQTDIVLMFVLAIHHGIAGGIMMASSILGLPTLWKHGALLELGFEVMDTYSIMTGTWPYHDDRVAPDLRGALLLHHVPGLVLLYPALEYGLNEYTSLMKIGGWMLLGACWSAGWGGYIYTQDFNKPKEMKRAAIAQTIATVSFVYVRWVEFPIHLLQFAEDVATHPGLPEGFPTLVKALGVIMGVFNLAVTATIVPKAVRYLTKAFWTDKVDLNDSQDTRPDDIGKKFE